MAKQAAANDDSLEAIKMLMQKHPMIAVGFICLALYGLSTMLFSGG